MSVTTPISLAVNRKLLEAALKRAAPFSGKDGRSRYGLLRAKGGLVELVCTDAQSWCRQTIKVEAGEFPDTCVEAAVLHSLVAGSAAEDVRLSHDGSRCLLYAGRGRYGLSTVDSRDFHMPKGALGQGEACGASTDLKEAVSSVAFCAEGESVTTWETGILLSCAKTQLNVVAASGSRSMIAHRLLYGASEALAFDIVIPKGLLTKAVAGLPTGESVKIQVVGGQLVLECGTYTVWLPSLNVNYPDWRRPMFKEAETEVVLLGASLQRALKAAAVVIGQATNRSSFLVQMKIAAGKVLIGCSGSSGDVLEEIDAEIKGEPRTAAFHIRTLTEGLGAAGAGNVTIQFQAKSKSVKLQSAEKPSWQCVVQQINV